jgi:hypothetical protein
VKRSLDNGLDGTVRELQSHRREIDELPNTGAPGDLRKELSDDLETLSERLQKEDFFRHAADLNSLLTHIKARVRETVRSLSEQQKQRLKEGVEDLQRLPEWAGLTQEERGNTIAQLEALGLTVSDDLAGLRKLLARDYDISTTIEELKRSIVRQDQERRLQELEEQASKGDTSAPKTLTRSISVPKKVGSAAQLDALIRTLSDLKTQLALYDDIDVSISMDGDA